ncbi:MAG TPA: hypothetical protein PLF13_04170 [candidate division Zixibacteria bacterium]|nr:hypothetical protein [candidate division Zixibacteria bacterium]
MRPTSLIKSAVFALFVTAMITGSAGATQNFLGGVHFNAGFPQGDFDDQIDRNAYGLGGQIFFAPDHSPFGIGLEVGWMNYGNESRREPFSTTIPDVTVEVETSNNLVQGFLIFRGRIPNGPIRPYGDALIGLNYLFTETSIKDADEPSEDIASTTNQDDAVFAYGFGGGVMVPIFNRSADEGKPITIMLDAGLRYVLGGEAEYLKKGSIARENGTVTYDLIKSRTDMLRLHIGIAVAF